MLFYLDTSALLKRYKTEAGTEALIKLFNHLQNNQTKVFISRFTILEVVSGLRRLLNTRDMSLRDFNSTMALFFDQDLRDFLSPYPFTETLLNEATEKV